MTGTIFAVGSSIGAGTEWGGSVVFAHGIGGRNDLPLPLTHMIIGAAIALVASFAALGVLWRRPLLTRIDGPAFPPVVTRILDAPATRFALRAVGLVAFAWVFMAAQFGKDIELNPTAGAVYVLLWVAVPLASVLFGPVWRLLNPLRSVHAILARVVGVRPDQGAAIPAWVGVWPAALALLSFVWLELVPAHNATVPVVRRCMAIYIVINLVAASYLGSKWFAAGDGFEVFSTLLGRLSPIGRHQATRSVVGDGRPMRLIGLRNPLANLAATPPRPGLFAVVGVLLGSTAFDSLSNSPRWVNVTMTAPVSPTLTGTLGLCATVVLITGAFAAAAALSARPAGMPTAVVAAEFAPTLVPIVLGYFIAHYWSLLVIAGQQTIIQLSDPLSTGANWLGVSNRATDYTLAEPRLVAVLQVSAIVTGHILGVLLAHEKALRLMPARRAVAGQLPMLVVMVAYTVAGLYLLFAS